MSICQIYNLCAETLWLGRYGENGARDIAIDVGGWFADLGTEGTVVLVNWRPGEDDTPYNPNITMDGSRVVWSPSSIDLAISGRGFAELRYYVGNALAKSKTFRTVIDRTPSEGANPPSAAEDWLERMEDAAVTAQTASETAVTAAETATEGAQAVAQALPTVTQAAATATTAAATATNAATGAALSEEVASAAANAAQAASESATAASQTAVGAASTATAKAAQAVEAASTATTKASEATQAATTATANAQTSTVKAGEATTAAATATAKATEATTAASTASAAATTATNAASTATSAASTATAAKTAAETAQTGAETAQTAAESAAASVTASAEQIETNKNDITELKADLSQKANIDGAYSDLTAGNAEQLVSTVYEEDSVPYIFRTAGGSMDIGDREEDMLVGGTVAWNQFANFSAIPSAGNGITYSSVDGKSVTFSGTANALEQRSGWFGILEAQFSTKVGHNILMLPKIVSGSFENGTITYSLFGTKWRNFSTPRVVKVGATASEQRIVITVESGTVANDFTVTFICVDLTQMFGSTIADCIYSLERSTAGAGVAFFRKYYPADYYPYDAGTLKSVEGVSSHDMVGFNQLSDSFVVGKNYSNGVYSDSSNNFMASPSKIRCIPNTVYCFAPTNIGSNISYYVTYYDINGNFLRKTSATSISSTNKKSTFTTDSDAYYFAIDCYKASGFDSSYTKDVCINLSWDGERDGEYEPYVKHSYPLDSSLTLRGIPKLDNANNLYYDGDTYESDGTVTRNVGLITFDGSEDWEQGSTNGNTFYTTPARSAMPYKVRGDMMCYGGYPFKGFAPSNYSGVIGNQNGMCAYGPGGTDVTTVSEVAFKDLTCSTLEEWKAKLAPNPLTVVYELVTPTTETAEPYQNPQIVDDFGTEEYVTTSIVPVGHVTKYQPNLRAKLEMSPDSPDGDGDYIVRQANGENSYVSLASTTTIQDILARLTALEGNT